MSGRAFAFDVCQTPASANAGLAPSILPGNRKREEDWSEGEAERYKFPTTGIGAISNPVPNSNPTRLLI